MKHIFILLFFLPTLSFAQTLKGIISFAAIDSNEREIELSKKAKKPYIYSFIYSNNISLQELISKEKTSIDTLIIHHPDYKELTQETVRVVNRASKIVYYNNKNENIYRLEVKENSDIVSIKDNIPVHKWSLQNDTQTIIGYTCKKATLDRILFGKKQHITAWYCEDIPIDSGPMDFSGLPGLILKVEIDNMSVTQFEKLKYFKDTNTEIEAPKNESELLSINGYQLKMMNKR